MTFGESLRLELNQITELEQKIFPIVAPEKATTPFVVYKREDAEFKKTLSGTSNKCHAIYELTLVINKYALKEQLEEKIINKLLSFLYRSIGDNGPTIQNVTVRLLSEQYELEVDLMSSKIRLEVDY